jgi:hypothetical protein
MEAPPTEAGPTNVVDDLSIKSPPPWAKSKRVRKTPSKSERRRALRKARAAGTVGSGTPPPRPLPAREVAGEDESETTATSDDPQPDAPADELPQEGGKGAVSDEDLDDELLDGDESSLFASSFPAVPDIFDEKLCRLTAQTTWSEDSSLTPTWPPHLHEDGDVTATNQRAFRTGDPAAYAWSLRHISRVCHAVHEGSLREIVRIAWQCAWVPLTAVRLTKDEIPIGNRPTRPFKCYLNNVKDSLRAARERYQRQETRKDRNREKWLEELSVPLLELLEDMHNDTKFYVKTILAYGELHVGERVVEWVKAEFLHSWEHADALARTPHNWITLAHLRKRSYREAKKAEDPGLAAYKALADEADAKLREWKVSPKQVLSIIRE